MISIHRKKIYPNTNPALYGDTIVFFFVVSDNLRRNFKSADISQSIMFDHKIESVFLERELTKRGSGYWKINNSILNDIDYTKLIKRVVNDFLIINSREYTSPHVLWETLKGLMRGKTIKFCALRKKNKIDNNT